MNTCTCWNALSPHLQPDARWLDDNHFWMVKMIIVHTHSHTVATRSNVCALQPFTNGFTGTGNKDDDGIRSCDGTTNRALLAHMHSLTRLYHGRIQAPAVCTGCMGCFSSKDEWCGWQPTRTTTSSLCTHTYTKSTTWLVGWLAGWKRRRQP